MNSRWNGRGLRMLSLALFVCLGARGQPARAADETNAGPAKTRVGVYDSRAVALSYYRSAAWRNELQRLGAEHEKAKAAGDQKRLAQLEEQGEAAQALAHRQTFGDAPIDNILTAMTNALPQIRKQANVQKLVPDAPRDASIEVVDVTLLMIEPFHPDEKTLKLIEGLKRRPPVKGGGAPAKAP